MWRSWCASNGTWLSRPAKKKSRCSERSTISSPLFKLNLFRMVFQRVLTIHDTTACSDTIIFLCGFSAAFIHVALLSDFAAKRYGRTPTVVVGFPFDSSPSSPVSHNHAAGADGLSGVVRGIEARRGARVLRPQGGAPAGRVPRGAGAGNEGRKGRGAGCFLLGLHVLEIFDNTANGWQRLQGSGFSRECGP